MRKQAYRVSDLVNITIDFKLSARNKDGVLVDVLSDSHAKRYMSRKYGLFQYLDTYDSNKTVAQNILTAQVDFASDYDLWRSVNADNIQRIYDAITSEYSPVENYNMIEKHTGTDTALKTPNDWKETSTQTSDNWKETETQTPTNWKEKQTQTPNEWTETQTQTPNDWKNTTESLEADNKSTTESYEYAYDSADASPSGKAETKTKSKVTASQEGTFETSTERTGTYETETERTGTYETERATTGSMSTEKTQEGTFEDKTTYNTTLTRNGNIGVSESSQLALHEIEFRLKNYVLALIDSFINEHCIYCDSLETVEEV